MFKKSVLSVLPLLMALCFTACETSQQYLGDYSYKTSGQASVQIGTLSSHIELPTLTGTMRIARLSADSILIVTNDLGGEVTTFRAGVSGNDLSIKPYTRNLPIGVLGILYTAEVQVSGSGTLYSDMLVLEEQYQGNLLLDGTSQGTLTAPKVNCVAVKNK